MNTEWADALATSERHGRSAYRLGEPRLRHQA
jgi:hypothetical protein